MSKKTIFEKGIKTNFTKLCNEVHSMKSKDLDFKKLQRKFSPYLKTSRLGDTIFLRLRFTKQAIRITLLPNLGHCLDYVEVYNSSNPKNLLQLPVENNKELMSKILFKHKLLNVE